MRNIDVDIGLMPSKEMKERLKKEMYVLFKESHALKKGFSRN